ncbi:MULTISPECIES: DUF1877 family protein [Variovorax]|jgi:hypothetical protein|uniref:DUF1877 family protein n=1 Tax=Variovorax TaxID=34072 RepID=UPI00089AF5BA|nr:MULTISPECIES: DUF1877 family protein [Variovorax]MDQ0084123.1 hypothetical protein [Variovorax boronicumulans]SDX97154.1 protein of unknown function [Variovorax sp. YR634]SDY36972.1 protein of unknown function [Variovorax sp. YR266]
MSIGGAFYALDRYRLRALVIDPSTVSGFLHSPAAQGGPHDSQTVEQAWDVVRTLLPEAVDGEELDGTDGLGCIYLTAAHVERTAARLAQRDVAELMGRFTGEPAKFSELYWAKVWQDGARDLEGFMEGVKRFFAGAAARRDAVVFYIV